jgi:hypothetical protein
VFDLSFVKQPVFHIGVAGWVEDLFFDQCMNLFPAVGSWQNRRIRADAMA